eukprot:ctg_1854.g473
MHPVTTASYPQWVVAMVLVVLADKLAAYAPGLEVTAHGVRGPSPLADRVHRGGERPVSSVEDARHFGSDELQPPHRLLTVCP